MQLLVIQAVLTLFCSHKYVQFAHKPVQPAATKKPGGYGERKACALFRLEKKSMIYSHYKQLIIWAMITHGFWILVCAWSVTCVSESVALSALIFPVQNEGTSNCNFLKVDGVSTREVDRKSPGFPLREYVADGKRSNTVWDHR